MVGIDLGSDTDPWAAGHNIQVVAEASHILAGLHMLLVEQGSLLAVGGRQLGDYS